MQGFDCRVSSVFPDEAEPVTVDAIRTRTPGLVVTRAVFREPGYERWWTITHTATGKHLPTYFPMVDQAAEFAKGVAPLTDWTATDPERDEQFGDAYHRAMCRHGGLYAYQLEPDEETTP